MTSHPQQNDVFTAASLIPHHPAIEEISDVLCHKTQNTDRGFFNTVAAFFLGKISSNMRASVVTKDRGEIPINMYAIALASSGYGKGHSVYTMEHEFLGNFIKTFTLDTLPQISDITLQNLANERAARKNKDPEQERKAVEAELTRAGAYMFGFDSGTAPAVKQYRQALLLRGIGAFTLQIDEIGSNLSGSAEILNTFLELYDQGLIKQKLVKNTNESIRNEELAGKTPANLLMFGTPSKLLDGSKTEDEFYSWLETGYARRCIFGFGQDDRKALHTKSADQIYQDQINPLNNILIAKWAATFNTLADPMFFNCKIDCSDAVAIRLTEYKLECERQAASLGDHQEICKAEMNHRFMKALKLAGALAFVDKYSFISMDTMHQAIKLVEESAEQFQKILNRERSYMRLANFIASAGAEQTHADLHEALPFYKSSAGIRKEMMDMAVAWGYKQHIIIKKTYADGVELFSGEKIKETDINKLSLSYSNHYAQNYEHMPEVPFDVLHELTQSSGMHWCNHAFIDDHREESKAIAGFNLLVVDCDGTVSIDLVKELMSDYKYLIHTTKRHTDQENRFRLILPANYFLKLDTEEYKQFFNEFLTWLPFESDPASNQRARKWETCSTGTYFYNEGKMIDVLPFIPKTSRNDAYQREFQKIESLDNLERWFAQKMVSGSRNNHMLRYALSLVDAKLTLQEVQNRVIDFNNRLSNGLSQREIEATIFTTVAKRYI